MRRTLLSLLTAVSLAGAVLAAQSPTPADPQTPAQGAPAPRQPAVQTPPSAATPQAQDQMILTGCLVQGSSPTVFILEDARLRTGDRADKATSYIVVASGGSIDLKSQLNHQVSVAVPSDTKLVVETVPSARPDAAANKALKMDEKDMVKITARSLSRVADTCTTVG